MKKDKGEKKAGRRNIAIIVLVVAGMVWAAGSGMFPSIVQNPETFEWQVVWKGNLATAAEADPGSGATGFLEIFTHNHEADPGTAYAENSSATLEGDSLAYASADNFNEEMDSETAFDFVVRARFNRTHCYDADHFDGSRCRVKVTISSDDWADGESISDVEGTAVESANNSDYNYIYINFYWNADDNNGYQLSDDGTITVTEISIEAKF